MTETITSTEQPPHLKELRKLHDRKHRERTGLFMAEGEDMLAAALRHGRRARDRVLRAGPPPQLEALLADCRADVEQVAVDREALASGGHRSAAGRA